MAYDIVFDIGGTYTKIALFKKREILEFENFKTVKNAKILDFLEDKIKEFLTRYKIEKFGGIGISAPGPLDYKNKIIQSPVNLPNIKKVNLKKLNKYCKKLVLENDANCAVLGARKEFGGKHIVCLTLGTGVGCGLILNGELYRGKGKSSEFGHTTVNIYGKKNKCSNYGCIENYISTRGLLGLARKKGLKVNCFELKNLADKGDKKALKTFEEYSEYVATAFVNLANTLDPELIIVTGGISHSSKYFLEKAKSNASKRYFDSIKPKIKPCSDNLSIKGAELLLNS